MKTPLVTVEGGSASLGSFLREGADAAERERARVTLANLSRRLQRELSLREPPIRVEEGVEGARVGFRGIAGTVRILGREIDIAPKYAAGANDAWRSALVAMVDRSAPRRASFTRTSQLQLKHRTFLDQFAYGFALELEAATQHADVRVYRSKRAELRQLRGRLRVVDQLRTTLTRPGILVCDVDSLETDNPTNRLLHWVGARLLVLINDPRVRRRLSDQLAKLPDVSQPVSLPTPLSAVLPRQYQHYRGAVELALAFARGRTTFPGSSDVGGAGFVLGTERLFESFVERSLAVAVGARNGWDVRAQVTEVFAVPFDEGRAYFSKPDNIVYRDDAPVLIVDAKYKRFIDATETMKGDRPSNADLYQMAAAALAHGCRKALLLYPRMRTDEEMGDVPWAIRWWNVAGAGEPPIRVGAAGVDLDLLTSPAGLTLFDSKLSSLIDGAWSLGESTTSSDIKAI